MKKKNPKTEWTLMAKEDLRVVLEFYKSKSQHGYNLVKDAILAAVMDASKSPEIFKADNLKKHNEKKLHFWLISHYAHCSKSN